MSSQAAIDALRDTAIPPQTMVIGGEKVAAMSGATLDVISPLNGQRICTIPAGAAEDAERAVAAARAAFDDARWRGMPPAARKAVMLRWADLIEAEALPLAVMGVRDNGTEIGMAMKAEPGSAIATIRYYAEAIDKIYGEIAPTSPGVMGLVHKEPVGVVAAIIPWNFPLMIGAWKLGPALAAGNSVVLKPSEHASLTLVRIAELALEAGMPPGVLNVVTGEGAGVGAALSMSMDVDVITFTGSGATGRKLLEAAARSNLKRCYLELGGKSANVVFADAPDMAEAAQVSAAGIFRNSGQVCVAGSRLLVERKAHDAFLEALTAAASGLKVGDPLSLGTHAGAVNNPEQLARNLQFVETAQSEGGRLHHGGARILQDTGGFFMEPTIITGVAPDHTIAREEVFGPVLAVTAFEGEDEALRLANATDYGLAGGVWTANLGRAHRMVAGMRTGVVHVNTYGGPDVTVPLGGIKQSGNGHDKSLHAFDKFLDLKTAWIKL